MPACGGKTSCSQDVKIWDHQTARSSFWGLEKLSGGRKTHLRALGLAGRLRRHFGWRRRIYWAPDTKNFRLNNQELWAGKYLQIFLGVILRRTIKSSINSLSFLRQAKIAILRTVRAVSVKMTTVTNFLKFRVMFSLKRAIKMDTYLAKAGNQRLPTQMRW